MNCTLKLKLDSPATPGGIIGPGADAREAEASLLAEVVLIFTAAGAAIQKASKASISVYGFDTKLSLGDGTPAYLPNLNRIFIKFKADANQFIVQTQQSTMFVVGGEAPIIDAAWALPVAIIDPNSLGNASGDGTIALLLGDYLQVSWKGQTKNLDLGPAILMVDSERLAIVALSAKGSGVNQNLELWADDALGRPSKVSLTWQTPFPLLYICQAAGFEAVLVEAELEANLDRPLVLDGSRVPVLSKKAQVVLIEIANKTMIFILAVLEPPRDDRKALSFALANAVLKSSPAKEMVLMGEYDGQKVSKGMLALVFILQFVLPTLPDPYAANFMSSSAYVAGRKMLDSPSEGVSAIISPQILISLVEWAPNTAAKLLFLVPYLAEQQLLGAKEPSFAAASFAINDRERMTEFARTAGLGGIILLDVSSNADLFGVSIGNRLSTGSLATEKTRQTPNMGFTIQDMYLQAPSSIIQVITVPEVQWEPVVTPVPTEDDPTFPKYLTFPDSGIPSLLGTETVKLVQVAPIPALDQFIGDFNDQNDPVPAFAYFTLPFGIIAGATMAKKKEFPYLSPAINYNRPEFPSEGFKGGHQVSIKAPGLTYQGASPGLNGFAVQLRNALSGGQPTGKSILDNDVDTIFNDNFKPGSARQKVPITRIDLSGYGESLFSDWRNPSDAAAVVSKALFNVIVGRTSHEVIQVKSILYPYAPRLIRTVTIQRLNSGMVVRHDSGWQPVTEGFYAYPDYHTNPDINPSPGIKTHPGVVLGIRNITNIRDTGQTFTTTKYGTQLMAVRFDADVIIDGVGEVPSRDQLGFVQLTDPQRIGLLNPEEYVELISKFGPLGGAVDCTIHVGVSGQPPQKNTMACRVHKVGVGYTQGMGGPEFVMTAWVSPIFPKGGQWSFLRQLTSSDAPHPVDSSLGIPIIREGIASSPPSPTSPYRFADPEDLARPDAPSSDYGILHASGTQRLFFPRPKIEATDPSRITSTRIPLLADPYTLATAAGFFPKPTDAIPFPDNNWAFSIDVNGNFRLELPNPSFPIGVGQRTISDASSVRSYADYNGSTVEIKIDTADAVPWSFLLRNVGLAASSGMLGEVMRVIATVESTAVSPTKLKDAHLVLGDALQPVQALMVFLQELGLPTPLDVTMTNSPKFRAGLKIPLDDLFELIPMPPGGPEFDDTDIKVTETIESPLSEAEFDFEATLLIPTPYPPLKAVGRVELAIKLSTESGTTFILTWGAGVGVSFTVGGFGCKAYFLQNQFLVIGDTVVGIGAGIAIKGSIDLKIVDVEVSVETKMAVLIVKKDQNCPDVTVWGAAQITFAVEVTIFWVIDISFEVQAEYDQNLNGGPCPLPDVL